MKRRAMVLLLALLGPACIRYEFEHEFFLESGGAGTVYVTGREDLWGEVKGLSRVDEDGVRALFARSGLVVSRTRVFTRNGRRYLFVAARFDALSRLGGTPGFPDLALRLETRGERCQIQGSWALPPGSGAQRGSEADALVAVRWHLPGRVYAQNAAAGVERGNILTFRETLAEAEAGRPLSMQVVMDARSLLWSTLGLFAGAIVAAAVLIAVALWLLVRRGRAATAS